MYAQWKNHFKDPKGIFHLTQPSNFSELKSAKVQEVRLRCQFLDDIKGNLCKNFLPKSEKYSSEIYTYYVW